MEEEFLRQSEGQRRVKPAVGTEDRRVTAEMCRTLVQQECLTDEQAEEMLDHLYRLASVVADAFLEQEKSVQSSGVCLVESSSESLASIPHCPIAPKGKQ